MKRQTFPTQTRLKELLNYSPVTGLFKWITTSGRRRKINGQAGCEDPRGYMKIKVDGVAYQCHRLAWFYHYGVDPGEQEVDHINGITGDNRIINLRLAEPCQNQWNSRKPKNNTSGIKGVCWNKERDRWTASIGIERKRKTIGHFKTITEAEAAIKSAREKLHLEFTRHA
jgi:hypothetical protein